MPDYIRRTPAGTNRDRMRPSTLIVLIALFAVDILAEPKWQRESGHSWRELTVHPGKTGFTGMGAETGIDFINVLGTNRYATNQNILNGSPLQWPEDSQ